MRRHGNPGKSGLTADNIRYWLRASGLTGNDYLIRKLDRGHYRVSFDRYKHLNMAAPTLGAYYGVRYAPTTNDGVWIEVMPKSRMYGVAKNPRKYRRNGKGARGYSRGRASIGKIRRAIQTARHGEPSAYSFPRKSKLWKKLQKRLGVHPSSVKPRGYLSPGVKRREWKVNPISPDGKWRSKEYRVTQRYGHQAGQILDMGWWDDDDTALAKARALARRHGVAVDLTYRWSGLPGGYDIATLDANGQEPKRKASNPRRKKGRKR